MDMLTKKSVPMDILLKGPEEQKVSKEEENTFILQVGLIVTPIQLYTMKIKSFYNVKLMFYYNIFNSWTYYEGYTLI